MILGLIVLPILSYMNIVAANNKKENAQLFSLNNKTEPTEVIQCVLNGFNYANLVATVRCVAVKTPDIPSVLIVGGGKTTNITNTIGFFEGSYPVYDSTPSLYPFDEYAIVMNLEVTGNNFDELGAIAFSSSIDGWSVATTPIGEGIPIYSSPRDGKVELYLQIIMFRGTVSKMFAGFIFTMMWVLSISAITIASSIWLRDRKVEPPTIAIMGGLLFALPSIRNSQPGAPMIGTTSDIAGFFFNMLLVSIAMVMLMFNYVKKYKAEKPKTTV
ncbi:hypothetical protein BC833DRAFT_612694 [Globomyces pollinis-pini]|nr:hypothetical protein BC833DRAFT_612694 [Globomyces pollinis-pini]